MIKYDEGYTKGSTILHERKLGLIFYRQNGRSAYKITKRLQVLDLKTDEIKDVWFAVTLNRIGYFLDPDRGYDTEAELLYRTLGWQIEGNIVEAIKND